MLTLLLFAFISGLITIAAPCIWPLLPIVLSSSATGGKRRPLGVTLGIMTSFALLTLTIAYLVTIIPFDPTYLRYFAVGVLVVLGLALIIPKFSGILESFVSRFASKAGGRGFSGASGFWSGYITGLSLGIVWTPCAGPILATIATLAGARAVTAEVVLTTVFYVVGVGIPLLLFATLGSVIFTKSRVLNKYTGRIQQVFGGIMLLTAILIGTDYDKKLQARLLDYFPAYSNFIYDLEGQSGVTAQLDRLTGQPTESTNENKPMDPIPAGKLPVLRQAPEFVGITKWLNPEQALTLKQLRGKVVLVDFWTYTCINCIRTLPHITRWYDTYRDQGLVVVGVHAPEFEFEKNTANVRKAIEQYKIHYVVAQDNDFTTWRAYNNRYWPAKYLIDAQGRIRYQHFGEGDYAETELAIQELLAEAGQRTDSVVVPVSEPGIFGFLTPETYLGLSRMDRFASSKRASFGMQNYTFGQALARNHFAYQGNWLVADEYSQAFRGARLRLRFQASKVFLVITPKTANDVITLTLDGQSVGQTWAGVDVINSRLTITEPRLYELIDMRSQPQDHILELEFETEGTQVFAFTFG